MNECELVQVRVSAREGVQVSASEGVRASASECE